MELQIGPDSKSDARSKAINAMEILIEEYGVSPKQIIKILLYDYFSGPEAIDVMKLICEEYSCKEILN